MDKTRTKIPPSVIIYDGNCSFCNCFVNFIAGKDKKNNFRTMPVQTKEARAILRTANEFFIDLQTIYLVNNGKALKRSTAVFNIFKRLPYPYKLLSAFKILPVSLTDAGYKIIARNRHKLLRKYSALKPR
jgi:predicted DCC family thiol-disulfide oxidoreductase YuxK